MESLTYVEVSFLIKELFLGLVRTKITTPTPTTGPAAGSETPQHPAAATAARVLGFRVLGFVVLGF